MLSQKQRGACRKVCIFFYVVHFGKVFQAYAVVLGNGVQRFARLHGVGVVAHGGFVFFLLNPEVSPGAIACFLLRSLNFASLLSLMFSSFASEAKVSPSCATT